MAEYSESSQSYAASGCQTYSTKEHLLPYSSLFPNITSISALLTELYKNYIVEIEEDSKDKDKETKKEGILILMLSFLTGNKIQEQLDGYIYKVNVLKIEFSPTDQAKQWAIFSEK